MPARRNFGWEPEFPDYRDYPIAKSASISKTKAAPNRGSLRPFASPVRDQGEIGSCTGFGVTAAVEILRRTDPDHHSTIYSPLFVYYNARVADGIEWKDIDSGAYVRDAVKSVVKLGATQESSWEYRPERFAMEPVPSAYKEAERWKAGAYYRCASVLDIVKALAAGYPVVGGFSCFTNMFTSQVDRTGIIPMPAGSFEGGHCVCYTGWDDTRRLFEFKNSWDEWGDGGYGYMPYAFIERGWATDNWAITGESPDTQGWKK